MCQFPWNWLNLFNCHPLHAGYVFLRAYIKKPIFMVSLLKMNKHLLLPVRLDLTSSCSGDCWMIKNTTHCEIRALVFVMQSNSAWLWNCQALSSQILVGKLLLPWRIWARSNIWPIKKKKKKFLLSLVSIPLTVSFCKEVKRVWGKYFSFHDDGVEILIVQLNNSSFSLFFKSKTLVPHKSLFSSPIYICWKLGKGRKG